MPRGGTAQFATGLNDHVPRRQGEACRTLWILPRLIVVRKVRGLRRCRMNTELNGPLGSRFVDRASVRLFQVLCQLARSR